MTQTQVQTQVQTQAQTRQITMTQALNEAMREEMRRDQRVFIMGEDIQRGVYGASGGLAAEFGQERCGIARSRKTPSLVPPSELLPWACDPLSKAPSVSRGWQWTPW